MNNDYFKEFELKQHTPLIHFQHDRDGATLRASEFKPKFDKYFNKKYTLPNKPLRYKLKIIAIDKMNKDYLKDGPFFGNFDQIRDEDKKYGIRYGNIKLIFFTYFDNELKDKITESIDEFLVLENFGTRNNKGYGCFLPLNMKRKEFEDKLKGLNKTRKIFFWSCDTNDLFFSIKVFYSLLKSGINLPVNLTEPEKDKIKGNSILYDQIRNNNVNEIIEGKPQLNLKNITNLELKNNIVKMLNEIGVRFPIYHKSLLFKYFDKKGISWEKKIIKEQLIKDSSKNYQGLNNERYVRGLLGVSDIQEWKAYNRSIRFKAKKTNDEKSNAKSIQIDRVPSPIFFKVFVENNHAYVYFMGTDFYKDILNKEFEIASNENKITLKIPDQFDLDDFLGYALKELNNISFISSKKNNIITRTESELNNIKNTIGCLND